MWEPEREALRQVVDFLTGWTRQSWAEPLEYFFGQAAEPQQVSNSRDGAQPLDDGGLTGQLRLRCDWDAYWATADGSLIEVGFYPEVTNPAALCAEAVSWIRQQAVDLPDDPWGRWVLGGRIVEIRLYGQVPHAPVLAISLQKDVIRA